MTLLQKCLSVHLQCGPVASAAGSEAEIAREAPPAEPGHSEKPWLSEAMGLQTFAVAPPADSQPVSKSKSWRCGYCGFTTFGEPWVEKVAEVFWNQRPLRQRGFH